MSDIATENGLQTDSYSMILWIKNIQKSKKIVSIFWE
jgi:hypothetical protein